MDMTLWTLLHCLKHKDIRLAPHNVNMDNR